MNKHWVSRTCLLVIVLYCLAAGFTASTLASSVQEPSILLITNTAANNVVAYSQFSGQYLGVFIPAGAGGLGVAPGVIQRVVGYRVPIPCAGALGCHEEDVSQVVICDPCIGDEFSVGQKPLAWAKAGATAPYASSTGRQMWRTPWESGGEHARAWTAAHVPAMRSCYPQGA